MYRWSSWEWYPLGASIAGEGAGDASGRSLSLSGDGTVLAVGAPLNDGSGSESGHVRVYKWSSMTWSQLGYDINGESAGDISEWPVARSYDGTVLAVGASFNDGGGDSSGHVRVYKWYATTWEQVGADIDGDYGDNSAWSISLNSDGTILAVGALRASRTGLVRVYKWSSPSWQ